MKTDKEKELAIKWKNEGKSYREISSLLNISRSSAQSLCRYTKKIIKKKRGPKFKLNKANKLHIKRQISNLYLATEKVTANKIKSLCNLDISISSTQRYLNREGYIYKKIKTKICLTKKHKQSRVRIIRDWLIGNHQWDKTIFSDEKRFSLDGPDDWRSYVPKNHSYDRQHRPCEGGGIMLWMMVMPNGLLAYRILKGNFNSENYLEILQEMAVPMMKLNYGSNFYFQQDNSPVHKSKLITNFFQYSKLAVIEWPPKSPDLNIVEDIWKLISDRVYDGPQFLHKRDLQISVENAISYVSMNCKDKITGLYNSIRSRLCTVLEKHGSLFNK